MDETTMRELVQGLIEEAACDDENVLHDEFKNARTESFGEAGLLTCDEGLVVRLANGAEFQITVVRSR